MSQKELEKELDEIVAFGESGGGFGAPEAEREHDRKFQLLMHKQNLKVK